MPDYRRTRETQPNAWLDLQALQDWNPREQYTPLDQIGQVIGPGGDGTRPLASPDQYSEATPIRHEGVKVDSRSLASGMMPDYISRNDDALKSPLQQIPEGLGRIGQALGNDLSGLGNMLSSMLPSQDTVMNGLNRLSAGLEAGGATLQGRTPLYVQLHQAARDNAFKQQQLDMQQDEMGMKRMQMAQQLQQQKLQAQQKMDDDVLGIWKDHQMPMAMKKKITQQFAQKGSALAANLNRMGDEHIVAEMETLAPFLPQGKQQELVQMMTQPNADLDQVEQWVNFARDKKKVAGEQRMKSERFSDLLKQHSDGGLDPMSPEFDEFKQMVMDREKRQNEATELNMKLKQLGIKVKDDELDLQAKQSMNQYGPEVHTMGGNVKRQEFNPQTGQVKDIIGTKPPSMVTNIDMKGEQEYTKKFAGEMATEDMGMLKAAREAPERYKQAEQIEKILNETETITGIGADFRLQFAKAMKFAGLSDSDAPENTEFLFTHLADATLAAVKQSGLGSGNGFSNTDREYLEKAKGGRISLEKESMLRLAGISKRVARLTGDRWNERVQQLPDSALKSTGLSRDPIKVGEKKKKQEPKGQRSLDDLLKQYGGK